MLITMTDRGPDSAGIAIYGDDVAGQMKITVQSSQPDSDFPVLEKDLSEHLNWLENRFIFRYATPMR